jgi:hypothetical protein
MPPKQPYLAIPRRRIYPVDSSCVLIESQENEAKMKTPRGAIAIVLGLSIASLTCCVSTQRREAPIKIEVSEYGIYACQKIATVPTPEASIGIMTTAKDFRLIEATDRIPMERGMLFGITVSYEDAEHESIEVTCRIVHPEMNDPYLKKVATVSTLKWPIRSGLPAHFGYMPQEDFEMVRGSWRFEIWYMDELSCSKNFTLF